MPEVDIQVAGRSYRVGCGEGEEAHLTRLAERIDTEASALAQKMGQVNEGRLMLMAALMLADRLSDAEAGLAKAEARAANVQKVSQDQPPPADLFNTEREAQIAETLDALAERIEALAGRVELAN